MSRQKSEDQAISFLISVRPLRASDAHLLVFRRLDAFGVDAPADVGARLALFSVEEAVSLTLGHPGSVGSCSERKKVNVKPKSK